MTEPLTTASKGKAEADVATVGEAGLGPETAMRMTGVVKSYPLPHGRLEVLRGVDLEVARGTILAILGASGAGKSTLLHLAGGLDRAEEGAIWVAGRELGALDDEGLARFRSLRMGFVFQFHHLLPEFSALENAMMPALLARRPERQARQAAQALLERVGLGDRAGHRPGELSGWRTSRRGTWIPRTRPACMTSCST
jgi:lipoprotein-releasing system ATP-binding protein